MGRRRAVRLVSGWLVPGPLFPDSSERPRHEPVGAIKRGCLLAGAGARRLARLPPGNCSDSAQPEGREDGLDCFSACSFFSARHRRGRLHNNHLTSAWLGGGGGDKPDIVAV